MSKNKDLTFECYVKLSDVPNFNRTYNTGLLFGNFGYKSNTDLAFLIHSIIPKIDSYTKLEYKERQNYNRYIDIIDFCMMVNYERFENSLCVHLPLDLFTLIEYVKTDSKIKYHRNHPMADIDFKDFLVK